MWLMIIMEDFWQANYHFCFLKYTFYISRIFISLRMCKERQWCFNVWMTMKGGVMLYIQYYTFYLKRWCTKVKCSSTRFLPLLCSQILISIQTKLVVTLATRHNIFVALCWELKIAGGGCSGPRSPRRLRAGNHDCHRRHTAAPAEQPARRKYASKTTYLESILPSTREGTQPTN